MPRRMVDPPTPGPVFAREVGLPLARREPTTEEVAAFRSSLDGLNGAIERAMSGDVMVGFDPAVGDDLSCLSIQSLDLGTPDMVIVNGRRYVPAEER